MLVATAGTVRQRHCSLDSRCWYSQVVVSWVFIFLLFFITFKYVTYFIGKILH